LFSAQPGEIGDSVKRIAAWEVVFGGEAFGKELKD
jgi:hypothetical protein